MVDEIKINDIYVRITTNYKYGNKVISVNDLVIIKKVIDDPYVNIYNITGALSKRFLLKVTLK